MSNSHRHIGFVAPTAMFEELHALAASRERSVSAEIRLVLRAHLESERARPIEPGSSKDVAMKAPVNDGA